MLLSDVDITRALQTGEIKLEPWFQDCVQPASVDVHLAPCFRVFDTGRTGVVDPKTESIMVSVTAGEEGFVLPPGGGLLLVRRWSVSGLVRGWLRVWRENRLSAGWG